MNRLTYLSGPPASAKTIFLMSFRQRLKDSYFIDGGNTTKAGIIDYLFNHRPLYLLADEIDKMSPRDQTFLLNLMETGIITETKYGKTRHLALPLVTIRENYLIDSLFLKPMSGDDV